MTTEQLEELLELKFSCEVPFGGDAPSRAALEGLPLVSRWPTNAASKAIEAMAATIHRRGREAAALVSR